MGQRKKTTPRAGEVRGVVLKEAGSPGSPQPETKAMVARALWRWLPRCRQVGNRSQVPVGSLGL